MSELKYCLDPSEYVANVASNFNKSYKFLPIYSYPKCFTTLAIKSLRGFKTKGIIQELKNLSKNEIKKSKLNNDYIIEHFVDIGYKKDSLFNLPYIHEISPLQIACAMYINTRKGIYLKIIKELVSFGANIHHASHYELEPNNEIKILLNDLQNEYKIKNNELIKATKQLNYLENKRYNQFSDHNERLSDDKIRDLLEDNINNIKQRLIQIKKRFIIEKKKNNNKKVMNPSPYMISLKDRQTTNDTSIIESFINGAIKIKFAITSSSKHFDDGLSQIIVEYCIGLNLRIWDL